MTEPVLIKRRGFPKIFFGWWTVIGSGVISLWIGGYGAYGFSALFKPIASELGFSRATTSVVSSISRFEGGPLTAVAGWITDRFGPRGIILFGVLFGSLGLILMNYVNSLWTFYLVWGVIVGTGQTVILSPSDVAVSNWFVKKRGLALSIKWVLTGLSGVAILPLIAWLITRQGWRMTCLIGGIVLLAIGLPVAWFCLKRHRPEYYGLLPDGAAIKEEGKEASQTVERGIRYAADVEEVEFTLKQAVRTPNYWLLITALTSHSLVATVINLHSIPFLTDIGFSPLQAAGMLAMLIFIGLPIRIIGGLFADRVKKNHLRLLFALSYFLQALGFAIFLLHQTRPMIYVWFIVYGIGNGLAYGLQVAIWGRYFGRKALGSIRGIATMLMTPVGMAAPIYAGWVYDTTGSYINAFIVTTIALVLAVILMALATPPKPPVRITDVHQIV